MNLRDIKESAIAGFLERCRGSVGIAAERIAILGNPTEEIIDAAKRRLPISLFARGGRMLAVAQGAKARLEENYLYDTRRFAGALASGEFLFFQNAVGQPAVNNGFPAGVVVMTELETNMDVAGQIAQGKNFVFNQLGISFNADITTADCGTMLEAGALRFEKQGGQYALKHGPIKLWPGGTGIAGYAATTVAATTLQSAHNGSADIRAVRKIAIPRIIREKESFSYKFLIPRTVRNTDGVTAISVAAGGVIMTIWLWGGQQDNIPI